MGRKRFDTIFLRAKPFDTCAKNGGNVRRLVCTLNLEEGPPMTMIWTVSLVCWSLATFLVASLATQSLGWAPDVKKKLDR